MVRETAERKLAQRAAHAMRAAVIRLARERAGREADPAQAYGCVDWFLYDVTPKKADSAPPLPAAAPAAAAEDSESPRH